MWKRAVRVFAGLLAIAGAAFTVAGAPAQSAPQVAPEAQQAVEAMGKALASEGFSFREETIREYTDASGQPLHIFHSATVVVRRQEPDALQRGHQPICERACVREN